MKTGDEFPPCNGFTRNTLSGNRAVLFGGSFIEEEGKELDASNVFVISFTDSCVVSSFLILALM